MARKKQGSLKKTDTVLATSADLASADVTGVLPVANGGTGSGSFTDGQLLIGNTTGNTLTKATLTAGTGIQVTNGGGSITIAATGGSVSPGGSNTQLQRNNSGAFGGISGATSDGTSVTFGSGNLLSTRPKITTSIDDANGNQSLIISATASAVNQVTVTNAATGNGVTVAATGSDTNIDLLLNPKGSGVVKANGTQVAVKNSKAIQQTIVTTSAATVTSNTAIPYDGTIPQNTEGAACSGLDTTITPSNSSSTLLIEAVLQVGNGGGGSRTGGAAIFRDSTANAVCATTFDFYTSGADGTISMMTTVAASSTSATTFKVRIGNDTTANMYLNRSNAQASLYGGVIFSSLKVTEILP